MKRGNARPLGHRSTILSEEQTDRVQRYVAKVGLKKAIDRLGVSAATLDNARFRGRMMTETVERVLASLEREERVAS